MAYLALEIIVAGKEETARHGRGHRGDAAENRFGLENIVSIRWWPAETRPTYSIDVQFPVGANVKQTAGGVVGTRHKRMAIGEELDGVDVGLVTGKGLDGLAGADVPELGKGVACARDEGVLVGRVEADAHDVAEVVGELDDLGARLDIPLHTCHIARRREDAAVVDEAAAREVAGVARQFAGDAGGAVAVRVEVVDGADVVKAAAGDVVAARGVGAGHDPRGPERDGVHLVGGVGVPDDELAVLRRRHEVSPVGRPVHGVDLCEMALQRPLGPHQLIPLDRVVRLRGDGAYCRARGSAWPAGGWRVAAM